MNDYLRKILSADKIFENESILKCDEIVTLDLSEINIFRVKNKFLLKNIEALKGLKNVKNLPERNDWLYVFLVYFKNDTQFLLAIADPLELNEDPYVAAYSNFSVSITNTPLIS